MWHGVKQQHAGLSQWQKVGLDRVHEVVESQPRLFSERMRLFVWDTCIYFAIFTDNICASSVINLTHTATQEQSEASSASTPIRLATRQSLHCPPPLRVRRRNAISLLLQSFDCGRSIDQFRLSPGRSCPYLSGGTESLSWHSYTPD